MRCAVIGGAEIRNYDNARKYLRDDDFIICCDSGLYHAEGLGIKPGLIVGDFDSHPLPQTDVETIKLPCEKDDTDTVYAVKTALERGFDEFLLLGVCGGRLDHTLGNVSILLFLYERNIPALIADDYGDMEIVGVETKYVTKKYSYFSLLNISGRARGIYVKNAKYPLENARIDCTYQYGISNEVCGEKSCIRIEDGCMLLMRIR